MLKKLPGLEVDRLGNATLNGKKITKLLVENKPFFNGGTRLGINNIPANVLDKIEIIEDYHDTAFLKGLESSDEIAMNIKLKEDKKEFIFGDIETATDFNNHYKVHPKIFRYAPKLSVNVIGDLNNTSDRSFTLSDYVDFEGGLNTDNTNAIFDSNLTELLNARNYNSNNHKFAGINFHFTPNDKLELRVFSIGLNDKTTHLERNTFNYFNTAINEQRERANNNKLNLTLNTFNLKYTPSPKVSFKNDTKYEGTKTNELEVTKSNLENSNLNFSQTNNSDHYNFQNNSSFEKRLNTNHTLSFYNTLKATKITATENYISTANIFSSFIPIQEDSAYSVFDDTSIEKKQINSFFKYYWVINRKNHLYFDISNTFLNSDYTYTNYQQLTDTSINSFDGFFNQTTKNDNTFFTGVTYKRIIGDFIASLKLRYEVNSWAVKQLNSSNTNTINQIIPEVDINWDVSKNKEISFKLNQANTYPNITLYSITNRIANFNLVSRGNNTLEITRNSNFSINYSSFKSYGWSIFSSLYYSIQKDPVVNDYIFNSIYTLSQTNQLDLENTTLRTSFRLTYNKPYWKTAYRLSYSNYRFKTLNAETIVETKRTSLSNSINFQTKFEDHPNIDLNLEFNLANNKNTTFKNKNYSFRINPVFEYNFNDWQINAEYDYTSRKESSSNRTVNFETINASIYYNKENSAWSFELKGVNITGNNVNEVFYFNDSYYLEAQTFIFPRLITFGINYKL